ncbi:hypothetical protein AAMO2058_000577400 [Amorphochlora amoebiformis]
MAAPMVLDNGSFTIKAGRGGEKKPSFSLRTVIAEHPQQANGDQKSRSGRKKKSKRYIFGHQAIMQQEDLHLHVEHPVRRGVVTSLDHSEALWRHCFKQVEIRPQESSVLLGLRPLTPKVDKQKIAQILFEGLQVSGAYVSDQCLLAMYSLGRMNGVVMDIGYETTFSTAVLNGQTYVPSTVRCDIGGDHVTRYLAHLLRGRPKTKKKKSGKNGSPGGELTLTEQESHVYNQIKENYCFLPENPTSELKKTSLYDSSRGSKTFRLPDGREIPVGGAVELFQAPEALFNPKLLSGLTSSHRSPVETSGSGISKMLHLSIQKCEHSVRSEVYKSMLVCGGPSMIPGMQRRLQREMVAVMPGTVSNSSSKYRLHLPPHRGHSSYLGGSILASLPLFHQIKMMRSEYAECGPSLVDRKCC